MKCRRCSGPMVEERVLYQGKVYSMRKCVMCGDLIDWIIALNRVDPLGVAEALKNSTEEQLREERRRGFTPDLGFRSVFPPTSGRGKERDGAGRRLPEPTASGK